MPWRLLATPSAGHASASNWPMTIPTLHADVTQQLFIVYGLHMPRAHGWPRVWPEQRCENFSGHCYAIFSLKKKLISRFRARHLQLSASERPWKLSTALYETRFEWLDRFLNKTTMNAADSKETEGSRVHLQQAKVWCTNQCLDCGIYTDLQHTCFHEHELPQNFSFIL